MAKPLDARSGILSPEMALRPSFGKELTSLKQLGAVLCGRSESES